MAKSTRSKVKRAFRAKKREQGVYAATEAARLNRLHQKLKGITTTDAEGDAVLDDAAEEAMENEDVGGGSAWMLWLGLAPHEALSPEVLEGFAQAMGQ
jgi:hypothetical protein